ncbi:conserved hypothetical protein [Aspergillus terreus NIH2624]|uniref:Leucine Rich Repeat domain protein n=1 Tax=Aspergillus terreus (strain NIH 2624 / FGSC A1156) TaxID=341663 RepID=Q0CTP3_ASPTN|nr:uncharacterized protein ATEG_02941 [Aspergillus terreus NIH2624]EAU36215.1 conserved hypothetical protein [Aspergillus terreus NIH2624]
MPFLWGDPASHFGTDNDAVYVALTRFRRTLKYARLEVRMLTHTLHMPPALSEIYGGPRPEWLREILERLPCLQALMVSKLPFFDHNAMMALKGPSNTGHQSTQTYDVRLLLADHEPNTTSVGIAETLLRFHELIYLDLSYTTPARDQIVLSALSQLEHLQVLKLRGIGLKDPEAEFLANAIGLRVRFLDLRNNSLTDMAVRSLLQASFMPPDRSHSPAQASSPTTRLLSSPNLDELFMKALTQPLTGRLWVEDLPHVGVTHLYIAENQLTVEGVAGLLASSRLHALDVGTVDTARSLTKGQLSLPLPPEENLQALPGAEKLIPILGSAAKDNLTYLRGHHAICTADAPLKEAESPYALLPELPTESDSPIPREAELDVSHQLHELPGGGPVFELPAEPVLPAQAAPADSPAVRRQRTVYEDEPLPIRRRGSVFAPEVVQNEVNTESGVVVESGTNLSTSPRSIRGSICASDSYPQTLDPVHRCSSPLPLDDVRSQKIQELLSKRPKNQTLPRRDSRENKFPYLHPSHVPHLETLVLTDVPSHIPAKSPVLKSLIRFITACSNEALLATLQAGSDYSLPPGQARAKAEQERARSLFSLRRLVLEVTPVDRSRGPTGLTAWKPLSYHSGTSKSSTGDRDLENLWSAAMDDFSFFGEDECGVPQNDPGKYFPMAVLNEKVTLVPEDEDSSFPSSSEPGTLSDNSTIHANQHSRTRIRSHFVTSPPNMGFHAAGQDSNVPPQLEEPVIDVVAELAAFRRAKKVEYEELVRSDRRRRSTINASSPASLLSPSSPDMRSPSPSPSLTTVAGGGSGPLASMAHFVEGHWKGEVKIVRNAAPKGRSGMVDMYGNYFEKGYLYP